MNVLVITGDKTFGPGHPRYGLQASAVETLEVLYWGRGALWPAIPAGQFDVVTVQDPFWRGLFAWCVARRLGVKFNVQVHTSVLNALGAYTLRRADSIRVVSEKIKKQVERLGVRAPVHVLPIFVDLSAFQQLQHEPHGQKTILWVGRFESEKDPLLALEVFKVVHAQLDAKLVMLGQGSLERALRAAAGNLPVTFPGWQPPAAYLAVADVVLSTSRHESYGASIIEALAAGVAVVAPDVGVAQEAGAIIAPRSNLGGTVVKVLKTGTRGELRLLFPTAQKWAELWRETL